MTAVEFAELIENPSLLKNYASDDLEKLIEKFPFFPLTHSLAALKAKLEQNEEQNYFLHRAAIRVPDRKKLFELLHENYPAEEKIFQAVGVFEKTEKSESEKSDLQNKEAEKFDLEEKEKTKSPEIITEFPRDEIKKPEEEIISDIDQKIVQEKIPTEKIPEISSIEKIETEENIFNLPGKDEVLDALKALRQNEKIIEQQNELISEQAKSNKENFQESAQEKEQSDEHSFDEWLRLLKQKDIPQEKIFDEKSVFQKNPTVAERKDEVVTRGEENLENEKMENPPIVTETLARIYEMQKKYDRAIAAYEQLSLLYPQKKAYFAQKISELKNL